MTNAPHSLPVYSSKQICKAIGIEDAFDPVAESLVSYSNGQAYMPPLGLLTFSNEGEAHIKSGYIEGGKYFATKIATMVSANRNVGKHTSDGVMILGSAETGFPLAVLHDRKYLTDIRTAAVGGIAARLMAPQSIDTVGVFGTGGQACLQLEALALVRPFKNILVWGRNKERSNLVAEKIKSALPLCKVSVELNAQLLVEQSQVIITATAATKPLICGKWLQPGTHITAVGADDEKKCELDLTCFERAAFIAVDSKYLATRFGDIASCHRIDTAAKIKIDAELGELLAGNQMFNRQPGDITISTHVGLGVEDVAIAAACFEQLMLCQGCNSSDSSSVKQPIL